MRIHRLFVSQPLAESTLIDLDDRASHYLGKVLRVKTGQAVSVFNGEGGSFSATVAAVNKKTVCLALGAFNPDNHMPSRKLHIAVGVSKGDKMDWLIQKATELGAYSIQPLLTAFCDVKLTDDRFQKKIQHWQQIAISSAEQCQRNLVPQVHTQRKMDDWINDLPGSMPLWLFHPTAEQSLQALALPDEVILCFGPEGGFSDAEVAQLASSDSMQGVSLGNRILRAETAPLAVLAACEYGRW